MLSELICRLGSLLGCILSCWAAEFIRSCVQGLFEACWHVESPIEPGQHLLANWSSVWARIPSGAGWCIRASWSNGPRGLLCLDSDWLAWCANAWVGCSPVWLPQIALCVRMGWSSSACWTVWHWTGTSLGRVYVAVQCVASVHGLLWTSFLVNKHCNHSLILKIGGEKLSYLDCRELAAKCLGVWDRETALIPTVTTRLLPGLL